MPAVAPNLVPTDRASTRTVFEACWAAHRARVFGWGLRYGGGRPAWAEDLTHDVFVRLWRLLDEGTGPEDLGGWLYRTTANLAFDRIRREGSIWSRVLARLRAQPLPQAPADAETLLATHEGARRALESLFELPPKERLVLAMKFFDGLHQRQIAAALGVTEGYVSKLCDRALARLRARATEDGDDAP